MRYIYRYRKQPSQFYVNMGYKYHYEIVDYIQENLKRRCPYNAVVNIRLRDYQKHMVEKIMEQNTLIYRKRQDGTSSLYVWIAQALSKLRPEFKTVLIGQRWAKCDHFNEIAKVSDIKVNTDIIKNLDKVVQQNDLILIDIQSTKVDYNKLFKLLEQKDLAKRVVVNLNQQSLYNIIT